MTAVVVDDETNLRDYLCARLAVVWPELQVVGQAANGRQALELIETHKPDVAFLDIKMPGLSGIEVASQISADTRIVFITAYDQFAVEAFEQAAVDYILKPVDDERLAKTMVRLCGEPMIQDLNKLLSAFSGLARKESDYLTWIRVGTQGETRIVAVDDVMFFRAEHKYTSVQTNEAEHLIRKSIKDLAVELDPTKFWRIHRSTLVNVASIEVARRDFRGRFVLTLKGYKQPLRVSDTYTYLFRQM